MSKGFKVLCLHAPNHISSVLVLFISRPETSWKVHSVSNKFWANDALETKAVVSSAYCDNMYSLL